MISDCIGLLSLLEKNLCEVRNHRLQTILERMQPYNWKMEHIVSEKNRVCDALSRLCKNVAGYSRYYPNTPPRLLDLSKRLAKHTKQIEKFDPLMQEMSKEGSRDADYLLLLSSIENKVEMKDLPPESELRFYSGCKDEISVCAMVGGHRLIVINGQVLVPKLTYNTF